MGRIVDQQLERERLTRMDAALNEYPGMSFTEKEIAEISGYSRRTISEALSSAKRKIISHPKARRLAREILD